MLTDHWFHRLGFRLGASSCVQVDGTLPNWSKHPPEYCSSQTPLFPFLRGEHFIRENNFLYSEKIIKTEKSFYPCN